MDLISVVSLLLVLVFFGWVVSRVTGKWLGMRDRIHSLTLKLEKAEAEREQSSKTLREMRERCRQILFLRYIQLSSRLHVTSPEYLNRKGFNALFSHPADLVSLWLVYEDRCFTESASPILSWSISFHDRLLQKVTSGQVTTGHLATWRTEIAAAQVYLLQLDGRGRMGVNGGTRHFRDDELLDLKGGMHWIVERTKTGNCPFPFGPYIERDLEALIARIEILESVA